MFHEFGHALHGMFSAVKYPTLAGTSVSRDFVEFPSTFQEDWAAYPQVIANYAKHYKTGEPIPKALLDKILAGFIPELVSLFLYFCFISTKSKLRKSCLIISLFSGSKS